MRQHQEIKDKYPDAVLLFRVGDFYETFGEDAVTASRVLGIVLTRRANGSASYIELAGFPYHALDAYLHRLVKAGHRVAICDQLEDPRQAKGIVRRGVTELVTPGTTMNDKLLENKSNNFLAACYFGKNTIGLAFLDVSTGEFIVAEGNSEYAAKLLQSLNPAEIIVGKNQQKEFRQHFQSGVYLFALEEWIFTGTYAHELLTSQFETHSLRGFGVEDLHTALVSAGAILHYLKDTGNPRLGHIRSLRRMSEEDFLWMDQFTIRNLDLLPAAGSPDHSLLGVLDHTVTPMGGRLMRRWMIFPLINLVRINERLAATEYLIREQDLAGLLGQHLKQVGDLERIVSKIARGKISPRELVQLARGLEQMGAIQQLAGEIREDFLQAMIRDMEPCPEIRDRIRREIAEDPPALITAGGLIREGIREELDQLRHISRSGKQYLMEIQQKEALATGIPSLKVAFNTIYGYYLEVTHTHRDKVPAQWIRKQTLTNAERYITAELKEYEEKITGAEEKIQVLEQQVYEELIRWIQQYMASLQRNGILLASLDCLICFASNAIRYKYRRPQINQGYDLKISAGRHPVIELALPDGETYVANDITLNREDQHIIILTGPNMSGKSALIRQTALMTIMAHMGSFVPAVSAEIGITDKIFTRVGASDNMSTGESTFMVEMNETAGIINNITPRSLVLLDEIGRGTSTYDGISIAWSIVEYLCRISKARPKTLFATHYHELNELENAMPGIRNYHITHREAGNKVIFLRKLEPGGSRHSFGIQVAKMAGMPDELIGIANEVLGRLEEKSGHDPLKESLKKAVLPQYQLSLFDAHSEAFGRIRKLLESIDIDHLTPVEALVKLSQIKEILR